MHAQVMNQRLMEAIDSVPAGAWGVGVSGGADSVALLSFLRQRADLKLHVLHVDHETRGGESGEDAAFVIELMNRWQLDGSVIRRSLVEKTMTDLPANLSARFRAVRLEFFRREVAARGLQGVMLAHHADDQAETVFERLLRGSGFRGLAGMSPRATIGGLVILRPLLRMRRLTLREHLQSIDQPWREDSSNASRAYLRNRVRRVLMRNEPLHAAMIELATSCRALRAWTRANAPKLRESFEARIIQQLPEVLAQESARVWLSERGVPNGEIGPGIIARLLEMVNDAASPARQHFPGKVLVMRRRGLISAAPARGKPRG
jgi:tRNA(Ile)-lysidine synthetase-like protein